MGFGGKMHDRIRGMGVQNAIQLGPVADIGLLKMIERRCGDLLYIGQTGRICQRVQIYDLMPGCNRMPHHC